MTTFDGGLMMVTPTPAVELDCDFRVHKTIAPAMYGQILLCTQKAEEGTVWIDTNSSIRQIVVKKVMLDRAQETLTAQQRNLDRVGSTRAHMADDPYQELRIAKVLRMFGNHTNVVAHYQEHVVDSTLYLVQQHCSGGDLHRILSKRNPSSMSETDAVSVMAQLAAGLAFLHGCGVAHRDVSLENILLHHSGSWKLADFGLAVYAARSSLMSVRGVEASCVLTGRVGKPYYMAPEVADAVKGASYDPFAAVGHSATRSRRITRHSCLPPTQTSSASGRSASDYAPDFTSCSSFVLSICLRDDGDSGQRPR